MPEIAKSDNFEIETVDNEDLKERMKGLLDFILEFYETHPDEGKEEDTL